MHQSLRGELNIGLMNNLVTQPRMRVTPTLEGRPPARRGVRINISMSTLPMPIFGPRRREASLGTWRKGCGFKRCHPLSRLSVSLPPFVGGEFLTERSDTYRLPTQLSEQTNADTTNHGSLRADRNRNSQRTAADEIQRKAMYCMDGLGQIRMGIRNAVEKECGGFYRLRRQPCEQEKSYRMFAEHDIALSGEKRSQSHAQQFCIIDDEVLITGSYNWSANAWNHFENIVVVKNDFKLVRAFLHEFEDLKAHARSQSDSLKICSKPGCRSHAFNWAIMDEGEGLYETVELVVWEVCATRGHAHRVGVIHIDHLQTLLGLVDQPEYETESDEGDDGYSKARMLHDFRISRDVGARFEHLVERLGHKIHAVGQRMETNSLEVIEYNESPDTRIFMHWRHMHHRKRIPQIYPQDDMESEDADRLLRGY